MKLILSVTLFSLLSSFGNGEDLSERKHRVMVRGTGAKEAARAIGGRIKRETKGGIISVELDGKTMVKTLKNKAAEMGFEIEDDPRREPILGILNDTKTRRFAESIPWGIERTYERNGVADIPDDAYFPEGAVHPICVIDSGYDVEHPDLPNDAEGTTDSWSNDDCDHGTHVSGTIAAVGGNNIGVVGVWPGAPDIKVARVFRTLFGQCQFSYASDLIGAAEDCQGLGAKITTMSLGGSTSSNFERDAFQTLYDDGMLHIAAAGNGGSSACSYPACYDSIMSVGATDINNNIAYFSQYNSQTEISAPGVDVDSTISNNSYANYDGTSMATPHVSGVALVLWNKIPSATNVEVREALNAGAIDLGASGYDFYYGNGLLNYWRSYDILSGAVTLSPTTSPTSSAPTVSSPPTALCLDLEIQIDLDNYPGETSWDVVNANGEIVLAGDGYFVTELITENYCIPPLCSYTFTIYDSYGDGLCCSYGYGSYAVTYDGVEVGSGASFFSSESTTFGCVDDCVDSGIPIYFDGYTLSCDTVSENGGCANPKGASHCPLTCNACEQYKCEDSLAPWKINDQDVNCAVIANLDPELLGVACSFVSVASTCRETCDYCN